MILLHFISLKKTLFLFIILLIWLGGWLATLVVLLSTAAGLLPVMFTYDGGCVVSVMSTGTSIAHLSGKNTVDVLAAVAVNTWRGQWSPHSNSSVWPTEAHILHYPSLGSLWYRTIHFSWCQTSNLPFFGKCLDRSETNRHESCRIYGIASGAICTSLEVVCLKAALMYGRQAARLRPTVLAGLQADATHQDRRHDFRPAR